MVSPRLKLCEVNWTTDIRDQLIQIGNRRYVTGTDVSRCSHFGISHKEHTRWKSKPQVNIAYQNVCIRRLTKYCTHSPHHKVISHPIDYIPHSMGRRYTLHSDIPFMDVPQCCFLRLLYLPIARLCVCVPYESDFNWIWYKQQTLKRSRAHETVF